MVQGRHEAVGKERQTEVERANAADLARAAMEVQLVSEQQRTAQLAVKLQEAAADAQVLSGKLGNANPESAEEL